MPDPPPAPRSVVALIDSANFYVSCERVFRPDLWDRPVAVLSNNDGCIVARSEEVKALGVKMGEPYFRVQRALRAAGAAVFSSNYALYADLSDRVASCLQEHANVVERYSIDEAFALLPRLRSEADQLDLGLTIHRTVRQGTGIPVRIGTGPTKVLAKVAQQLAKAQYKRGDGPAAHVEPHRDDLLAQVPVEGVWGIGPAYAKKLRGIGVTDARGLRDVPDAWARKHLTVVGLRLVWELRGISCLPMEEEQPVRKTLIRSRSFGEKVYELADLREAVATHAARAAEKLRRDGLVAAVLQAFITTGPHAQRTYSNASTVRLLQPSNYTPDLVHAALRCLDRVFVPGFAYKKAGVVLLELAPEAPAQANLFTVHDPKRRALMDAVDQVNARYGRGALAVASCGVRSQGEKRWARREEMASPHYTTRWEDLPRAKV